MLLDRRLGPALRHLHSVHPVLLPHLPHSLLFLGQHGTETPPADVKSCKAAKTVNLITESHVSVDQMISNGPGNDMCVDCGHPG